MPDTQVPTTFTPDMVQKMIADAVAAAIKSQSLPSAAAIELNKNFMEESFPTTNSELHQFTVNVLKQLGLL